MKKHTLIVLLLISIQSFAQTLKYTDNLFNNSKIVLDIYQNNEKSIIKIKNNSSVSFDTIYEWRIELVENIFYKNFRENSQIDSNNIISEAHRIFYKTILNNLNKENKNIQPVAGTIAFENKYIFLGTNDIITESYEKLVDEYHDSTEKMFANKTEKKSDDKQKKESDSKTDTTKNLQKDPSTSTSLNQKSDDTNKNFSRFSYKNNNGDIEINDKLLFDENTYYSKKELKGKGAILEETRIKNEIYTGIKLKKDKVKNLENLISEKTKVLNKCKKTEKFIAEQITLFTQIQTALNDYKPGKIVTEIELKICTDSLNNLYQYISKKEVTEISEISKVFLKDYIKFIKENITESAKIKKNRKNLILIVKKSLEILNNEKDNKTKETGEIEKKVEETKEIKQKTIDSITLKVKSLENYLDKILLVRIDSISVEISKSFIENLVAVGEIENLNSNINNIVSQRTDKVTIRNIVPIGISTLNALEINNNKIKLFSSINGIRYSIPLTSILTFFRPKMVNNRRDYSPSDTSFYLKKTNAIQTFELKKEANEKLFDIKIFSDLIGIGMNNSNGLIQTEFSKDIYLSPYRYLMKKNQNHSAYYGFVSYLKPEFTWSKIENNNKNYILAHEKDSISYNSTSYISTLGLKKNEIFNLGLNLNLGMISLPFMKSNLYTESGLYFGRTGVCDSINNSSDSTEIINERNVNTLSLTTNIRYVVQSDERYFVEAKGIFQCINLIDDDIYQKNNELTNKISVFNKILLGFEIYAGYTPIKDSNGKIFVRYRYLDPIKGKEGYSQLQIGYSYNFTK